MNIDNVSSVSRRIDDLTNVNHFYLLFEIYKNVQKKKNFTLKQKRIIAFSDIMIYTLKSNFIYIE